ASIVDGTTPGIEVVALSSLWSFGLVVVRPCGRSALSRSRGVVTGVSTSWPCGPAVVVFGVVAGSAVSWPARPSRDRSVIVFGVVVVVFGVVIVVDAGSPSLPGALSRRPPDSGNENAACADTRAAFSGIRGRRGRPARGRLLERRSRRRSPWWSAAGCRSPEPRGPRRQPLRRARPPREDRGGPAGGRRTGSPPSGQPCRCRRCRARSRARARTCSAPCDRD